MVIQRGIDPLLELQEQIEHPFGKGPLTTSGVQYGTAATGLAGTSTLVEAGTITLPTGAIVVEAEFGLTMAVDSAGTNDGSKWLFQVSDAGTAWTDLIAEQTAATAAAYADVTCSGRFAPTGNFLGTAGKVYVRGMARSAGTTDLTDAKVKNSSYVLVRYKMW